MLGRKMDKSVMSFYATGVGCAGLAVDEIIVVRSSGSERDVRNLPAFNAAWSSAHQRNIRAVCRCGVSGEFGLAIFFQFAGRRFFCDCRGA